MRQCYPFGNGRVYNLISFHIDWLCEKLDSVTIAGVLTINKNCLGFFKDWNNFEHHWQEYVNFWSTNVVIIFDIKFDLREKFANFYDLLLKIKAGDLSFMICFENL